MKKIGLILTTIFCAITFTYGQSGDKKKIYDETADAKTLIANAINNAGESNKHVLLQIGGNWCAWCIMFDKLITTDEEIKSYISENFEVVHVNHSPKNKNEEVLAELRHPERFGFPVFVILDHKGNLIHTQNSAYLESKEDKGHDRKLVLEFLQSWSYKALDPDTYKK